MAAVLQNPEASAKALEQVTLARAQLAALGPKKLAALAKEFPELPALGFIAQGVPETDGEEPATPRFLSSLMELFNPAQAFQVARPPIGRWDPLKIREQGPERYRRFVEMEIKHGRLAMAGFLGAITTYSGIRW